MDSIESNRIVSVLNTVIERIAPPDESGLHRHSLFNMITSMATPDHSGVPYLFSHSVWQNTLVVKRVDALLPHCVGF